MGDTDQATPDYYAGRLLAGIFFVLFVALGFQYYYFVIEQDYDTATTLSQRDSIHEQYNSFK